MPTTYIKEMVERDIQEKEAIKSTLNKLTLLITLVTVIGFFLVVAFGLNIFVTSLLREEVLQNREETKINRTYGTKIINKLDSLNTIHYSKK